MKVEIWSDVMCPWCYIGKRRFESALQQFGHQEEIEIVWKSFQLNPSMKTDPKANIIEYLANEKGWTLDHSMRLHDQVVSLAKAEGLDYRFDKAVVANSFEAHRFLQFAKKKGLGDAAKERLFSAYFTEGKNIADHATLTQLGLEIGLDAAELKNLFEGQDFAKEVKMDIMESQQIGVRGVPFFVVDRKYGVSGAQTSDVFLQVLEKSFAEWEKENPKQTTIIDGQSCSVEGECD